MDGELCDRECEGSPREPSGNDAENIIPEVERTMKEAVNTKECNIEMNGNSGEEVESIYLDDGSHKKKPETVKPQRKLTKAQLAAMEALASFGGSDLGSVNVKRRDLRDELKRETELLKSQDALPEHSTKRPCTRLQAAKQETDAVFKDIALGDGVKKKVPSAFKRKRPREEDEGFEMKRLSKLDKAKAEALEAFGGVSFESLSKKPKIDRDNVSVKKQSTAHPRISRLTRAERARLEALQTFGGSGLGEVMDGSKKRIARTLEIKSKEDDQSGSNDANKNDDMLRQQQQDKENLVNQITT